MSDLLLSTLPKVLLPAFAIGLMLFVARRRGLSPRDDLGLQAPHWGFAAIFAVLWLCVMAFEEYLTRDMPGNEVKLWPSYPAAILVLRIVAIGFLGPIAEELAFRGFVMRVIGRSRAGIPGAILISAALWSAMHLQYAPITLGLIFIDGIMLGLARHFAKSLYVPIVMHVLGNLFSIYQSLSP
jgi:membrane protease YdiL (CAAX protease family)